MRRAILGLLVTGLAALSACSSSTDTSGAQGSGGQGGAVPTAEDLFACTTLDCDKIVNSVFGVDPDQVKCLAELVVSGNPGVVSTGFTTDGGEVTSQGETRIILLGTGKAVTQSRTRECDPQENQCDPWGPSGPHQTCDVSLAADTQSCADGSSECTISSWGALTGCEDTPDEHTCDSIGSALGEA